MKGGRWLQLAALGILLVAAFFVGRFSLLQDEAQEDQPKAVFNCAPGAAELTTTVITGPAQGQPLAAGTELRWERTGHDICGGFGSDKRYSLGVCPVSTLGGCLPNNGIYTVVRPEDLGWEVDDPGVYQISQEQIVDLVVSAANASITLANGSPVYFQIRYVYTNFNNVYNDWAMRALTLDTDGTPPPDPGGDPVAIPDMPSWNPPQAYGPNGPFTATWNPAAGATSYQVQLAYRAGDPGGSDMGTLIGMSDLREVADHTATFEDTPPVNTGMIVWAIAACNAAGCSDRLIQGVLVQPPVSAVGNVTTFSAIEPAFRAPSCINCHAVAATDFQNQDAATYEQPGSEFFGLPPNHPPANAGDNCTGCHSANQMPEGSHPVPWQAAPESMDLREMESAELCEMAKDPGSIAENVVDHLLGDPLILWAVEGGPLPAGAQSPNTDQAFNGDWQTTVQNWVDQGMNCN